MPHSKSLKVSPRSVKAAKQVQKHGSDELKQAVTKGKLRVSAAAKLVRTVPNKQEQTKAINAGTVAETIKPNTQPEIEFAKAFSRLENRLVALRKIFEELKPHEAVALQDWIEDSRKANR